MLDIFKTDPVTFPQDFFWGSATAGHQIEGNNVHSQWWHWERAGKYREVSGKACDHYNRVEEDVALLSELGHGVYRMSVEWSRIEPVEGKRDEEALAHYLHELELLKKNGIKTWVTLHHFTHPLWFEEKGEFNQRENIKYFQRHLEYLVPRLADLVEGWNVFNEFNIGYLGELGTQKMNLMGQRKLNMVEAHARAYHYIKTQSRARVSSAHAFIHIFPTQRFDRLDRLMANHADFCVNEFFLHALRTGELVYPYQKARYIPEVKGALDFWAVNSYTRHMIDGRRAEMRGDKYPFRRTTFLSEPFSHDEFYPEGFMANLERLKDWPVVITENGCGCEDDRYRIIYLSLYLSALREAMNHGVKVEGYLYWSTMDNYEWGVYYPTFGLLKVDRKNFTRSFKPSAYFYRDIIQNHGFDGKLIRKHLKSIPGLE